MNCTIFWLFKIQDLCNFNYHAATQLKNQFIHRDKCQYELIKSGIKAFTKITIICVYIATTAISSIPCTFFNIEFINTKVITNKGVMIWTSILSSCVCSIMDTFVIGNCSLRKKKESEVCIILHFQNCNF